MFGKNKPKENKQPEFTGSVQAMPEAFYGGKNPVVYDQKVAPQGKKTTSARPSVSPATGTSPAKGARAIPHQNSHKKLVIILGSIAFVLIVGGISWYYVRDARPAAPEQPTAPIVTPRRPIDINVVTAPTSTREIVTPTTTAVVEEPPEPPSLARAPIEFPKVQLIDATDIDADSLTDAEEEIFQTDSGEWDTDGDGYFDGQEVTNLYNPSGDAPKRIIDSGLVGEYVHPIFKYRFYYPSEWELDAVQADQNHILVTAATGDFLEVIAVEKEKTQSFTAWFAEHASSQRFLDVSSFTNRFQEDGYRRKDFLVSYFPTETHVYVLLYQPSDSQPSVTYRQVAKMMAESFRPQKSAVVLPDQVDIPKPLAEGEDQPSDGVSTTSASGTTF